MDVGHINDVDELARIAEEHEPGGGAAAFLREHCHDLTLELAMEKLAVERRAQTYRRHQELVIAAEQMAVAIVPPIPPYLFDLFGRLGGVTILQLDHHELPPHLRGRSSLRLYDAYDSRRFIKTADLVLFDAYSNGTLHIRRPLADLLDDRILKPAALLRAHLRPHLAPEDVEVSHDIRARVVRI